MAPRIPTLGHRDLEQLQCPHNCVCPYHNDRHRTCIRPVPYDIPETVEPFLFDFSNHRQSVFPGHNHDLIQSQNDHMGGMDLEFTSLNSNSYQHNVALSQELDTDFIFDMDNSNACEALFTAPTGQPFAGFGNFGLIVDCNNLTGADVPAHLLDDVNADDEAVPHPMTELYEPEEEEMTEKESLQEREANEEEEAPHGEEALDEEESSATASPAPFIRIPNVEAKIKEAQAIMKNQNAKVYEPTAKVGASVTASVSPEGVFGVQGVYWKAPVGDETIPTTYEEKMALKNILVAAIKNNQNCKDKQTQGFLNRWGNGASYYSPTDIEALAWKILSFMIKIHEDGWSEPIFDRRCRDQIQTAMFFTFEEQFLWTCQVLYFAKRSCQDLFKGERRNSIIGNPYAIDQSTSHNSEENQIKAVRISLAPEVPSVGKRKRKAQNEEPTSSKRQHEEEKFEVDDGTESSVDHSTGQTKRVRTSKQ